MRAKVVEKGKREREIGKKAQRVREWEKEKAKEGECWQLRRSSAKTR